MVLNYFAADNIAAGLIRTNLGEKHLPNQPIRWYVFSDEGF